MKRSIFLLTMVSVMCSSLLHAQSLLWTSLAHPDSLQVNGISFSHNGNQVLSGTNCHPSHIRLFDVNSGNLDWDYVVSNNLMCMMSVGVSANGNYFAAVEELGNLLIFDNTQAQPDSINTIALGQTYAFSVCFSPNSFKVAVGASGGSLQTFRVDNGAPDLNIAAHASWVTAVTYSPDGSKIATGGSDNKVKIWDTTGTMLYTLTGHTDDITSVKFSPDNLRLFSSSKDNKIKIWDAVTGTLINTIVVSGADVNGMDVAPNGNRFVAASDDGYIRVFDANSFARIDSVMQDGNGFPLCVSYSPDGTKISTGTSNGLASVYDMTTVGVSEFEKPQVFISPNPFTDFVVAESDQPIIKIEIFDVAGKQIFVQQPQGISRVIVPSSVFGEKGIYLFRTWNADGSQSTQKLLKQ